MEQKDFIKVGFCVAYDWALLRFSLPIVYRHADRICLSLDKDCISWGGEPFSFDHIAFNNFIESIDVDKKISLFKDDFHLPHLTPMQNEVRQRNAMASHLGEGGWHIQLDADEYFINFDGFVSYLKRMSTSQTRRLNVSCPLITLFKKTAEGYLYIPLIRDAVEYIQIATREPFYETGRRNGNFNHLTDFIILHQSWARNEEEVLQKLKSWGHKSDFDASLFFNKWKTLTTENYQHFRNFHPLSSTLWPSLALAPAKNENELIDHPPDIVFPYSKFELALNNSRNLSRAKSLFKKIFR